MSEPQCGAHRYPRPLELRTIDSGAQSAEARADVAALAVHIMTNTALTGATYDIDGGQQFASG
jgi:hypothetical protein